ncbi:hypothetical protein BX666DRAFT_1398819 [Dichotomocladium elegans]|nr:hypothetical protein BX666DRAFT_1398819 [Dichotomocladium elegans]
MVVFWGWVSGGRSEPRWGGRFCHVVGKIFWVVGEGKGLEKNGRQKNFSRLTRWWSNATLTVGRLSNGGCRKNFRGG